MIMIAELTAPVKRAFLLASLTLGINLIFSSTAFCRSPSPDSDSTAVHLRSKGKPCVLNAVKIQNGGIRLDGILDENDWNMAPSGTNFIQNEPNDGMPSSEKTTVRILYDDENIYAGIIAYDSCPDQISARLARRDDEHTPSDWLHIAFDSYNDNRTAFQFSVNPAGVKQDCMWSEDTESDINWNAVWGVATKINKDCWVAEFCIPFSQLRYSIHSDKENIWGLQIGREILRNKELSLWSSLSKDVDQFVSLFGDLNGLKNLPESRNLEILPYTVGGIETWGDPGDNPFKNEPSLSARMGADIKYGITSNMTLNATINPDFGQVEQDPSELNLSRYERYLNEKRPFFMEGANLFEYPVSFTGQQKESLFYSRRIGRSPQLSPYDTYAAEKMDTGSVDLYSDTPQFARILGAAKLTGRTSSGWSVGILEAVTNSEETVIKSSSGDEATVQIVPMTNYFVSRALKDYNDGRSTLGGIFTAVNRNISNDEMETLRTSAYTSGIDFSHRWHDDEFRIDGKVLASHVRGSEKAITATQESSARYYQRPDADHLGVDTTLTYLNGFSANLVIGRFAGEHWRYGMGLNTRTPGFEINDIGYIRDTDQSVGAVWVNYNEFEPGDYLRNWRIESSIWKATNYDLNNIGAGVSINGNLQTLDYFGLYFGGGKHSKRQNNSLLEGGPSIITPGDFISWFGFHTDHRKTFSLGGHMEYNRNDEGFDSYQFGPSFTFRPPGRFEITLRPSYSHSQEDMKYIEEINGKYIIGHLDRENFSTQIRIDLAITPDMTLQFYGMPYLTAGTYTNFREVTNRHAENYNDRFAPYSYGSNIDFNFKQLRSNLVFRWEFSPGSTIYFVWAREATDYEEEYGMFDFGRDFDTLLSTRGNNTFIFKINKWFNI